MNAENGKVEASLPIGAGVDATKVMDGRAFASCHDGTLTVAFDRSGNYQVEQVVKTPEGARTMDVDPATHRVYLPTAELEPAANGKRPQPKPGTFMIVVVGK
jgi:hypothetical protein